MTIYHYVPPEEIELHEFDQDCPCEPTLIIHGTGHLWLADFLGCPAYEHHSFSPLARERDDFVAAGENA